MPSYRVSFINQIPRAEKLFRCYQRSIIIDPRAAPKERSRLQRKRFARLEGIGDWKIHTALIEIEPIEAEAKPPDGTAAQRKPHPSHKRGMLTKGAHPEK